MSTEKPFLNFSIDEDLLKKIDDYRFKNRFPSRAATVKHLIELGLKQEQK